MVKCPSCLKNELEEKKGVNKLCAQIGNPDIAIVEVNDPYFCSGCNEFYLDTKEVISSIIQVMNMSDDKKTIEKGIYS